MPRLLTLAAFLFIGFSSKAQFSNHALGLRYGAGNISGSFLSYQYTWSDYNRVQVDYGLSANDELDGFKIMATYQWMKPLPNLGENFQWFYGIGLSGSGYESNDPLILIPDPVVINLETIAGIEYDFSSTADLPLMIGLDVNPSFNFFSNFYESYDSNIAVSLRWQF